MTAPAHTHVFRLIGGQTICAGDWIKFQQIKQGELITEQGNVTAFPDFPKWLWVGGRIVADSDGKPLGDIIVLAHKPADATDRIARAIAEADDNSRPGCVYVKLAKAAMAADGAE